MAKAFLLVRVTIPDLEAYRASGYMDMAEAAVVAHGGRFLVRGGDPKQLEGADTGARTVILEFPSREAAERFWTSPEYGPALALRQSMSTAQTLLLSEYT